MKPILFNTDMVRAILDGRKTVTRRLVKFKAGQNPQWTGYVTDGPVLYGSHNVPAVKSNIAAGDILYVRETWTRENGEYYFRADFESDYLDPCETLSGGYPYECTYHPGCEGCGRGPQRIGWRPSIHMPKEAARILLRVKDVRVERLQDMRLIDCLKEGVALTTVEQSDLVIQGVRARERFSGVWDGTIKPADLDTYGWDANPWVWVIEFEKISKEDT